MGLTGYTTGVSQTLQTCGNIYIVTVNVIPIYNNLTKIDADTKLNFAFIG